jgi:hypothetical protein
MMKNPSPKYLPPLLENTCGGRGRISPKATEKE